MSEEAAKRPTQPQALIIAAMNKFGSRPFTVWDLTVAAHGMYPDLFCMPGYPSLPSDNRVKVSIISSLKKRFLVEQVGPNKFQLTGTGMSEAAEGEGYRPKSNGWAPARKERHERKKAEKKQESDKLEPWAGQRIQWLKNHKPATCSLDEAYGFWGGNDREAVDSLTEQIRTVKDEKTRIALIEASNVMYMRFHKEINRRSA